MARLPNKGYTARAPQTGASVPELPDFNAEFAAQPGGEATNAALQRWWDLVRQRIEFNNGSMDRRLATLTTTFNNGINTLTASITHEETVRADADVALAVDIGVVSAAVDGLSATVTTIQSALATASGYLESRWMVNAAAGPIVTGMTLFSASGPVTDVSYIAFQADRFQINTATGGNKLIFSATATAILLGNVLTVDLANSKIFIGTGTYGNANTGFYVDSSGNFSLKDKLTFDGTTLAVSGTITAGAGSIGGWDIGTTTISKNNVTLNSAGTIVLGTSSDVLYMSAADATYRLWAGNATAASATFSVTKAGALFCSSGTIGGFTLTATTLTAGSGATLIRLNSTGSIALGDVTAGVVSTTLAPGSIGLSNAAGDGVVVIGMAGGHGVLTVYDSTLVQSVILSGGSGAINATGTIVGNLFSGSGASLTTLNGSNISSGTVAVARLGSGSPSSANWLRGDGAWTGMSAAAVSGLAASATTDATNASNIGSGTLSDDRLPASIFKKLELNPSSTHGEIGCGEVAGADSVFAAYFTMYINGGTKYVPFRTTAP